MLIGDNNNNNKKGLLAADLLWLEIVFSFPKAVTKMTSGRQTLILAPVYPDKRFFSNYKGVTNVRQR